MPAVDDGADAVGEVLDALAEPVAERASALLKVTFKALRRVSLDPAAITRIARAALVLLQLGHGRTT